MPNCEELKRVLKFIQATQESEFESERRSWNQMDWVKEDDVCGTAYCFAGWTAVINGYTIGTDKSNLGIVLDYYRETINERGFHSTNHIAYVARDILGLTDLQADRLFNANNAIEDLERMVDEFCSEQPCCEDCAELNSIQDK